jgi:hypothetical protein
MDPFERVHDLGPLQNGIQGMRVREIEIHQSPHVCLIGWPYQGAKRRVGSGKFREEEVTK